MSGQVGRYGDHPDTVSDGLRLIADWMDQADQLIDRTFAAHGKMRANQGDQVQQDVRRLADWFAAHPEVAEQAWSYVCNPNVNTQVCPECPHDLAVHSRVPGIGCLHEVWCKCGLCSEHYTCPCSRRGTSEADQ